MFVQVEHIFKHWAIPENIHTIPRTAFRISEGEGGFTIMEFWGHGGAIARFLIKEMLFSKFWFERLKYDQA